jgi:hypothetical protein
MCVVALLGGCVAQASPDAPHPTPTPLSGVVATGTLLGLSPSDPITGSVTITANPANAALTVRLIGLTGDLTSVGSAALTAGKVKANSSCAPYGLSFAWGTVLPKADQKFTLPSDKSPGWDDPSFLHALILTSTNQNTPGCGLEMVAYAPLTWTVGDRRPDLNVTDHGSRSGAEGHTATAAGRPTAYTVVRGDNLSSIAKRFGLTLDDLFYLNPARLPGPTSTVTDVGEVLNLSNSSR